MFKKMLIGMLLSLGILLAVAPGTPVSANNHSDTGWSFWLSAGQGNSYTESRKKEDASYAYIYNNANSRTGVNAWVQYANGQECGSPKTHAGLGQARKIWNNAYENFGYHATFIRLAIEQDRYLPIPLPAAGVWSPDSK